jgi:hypothetical protein
MRVDTEVARNRDGTFRVQPPKAFKDYQYKPRLPKAPPPMALVRYKRIRLFRCLRTIRLCLCELGMTNVPENFSLRWREDPAFVEQTFNAATVLYERLRFHFHPRTLTDSLEPAKSLHALWARIKKLFRNRLQPCLFHDNRNHQHVPQGFHRCVVCPRIFKPKRKRRSPPVCSNTCAKRLWRKRHLKKRIPIRCANPRCPVRFIPIATTHKFHSTRCAENYSRRLKRLANPGRFRAKSKLSYRRNRKTILKHRLGRYSRVPEEVRARIRKRSAIAGFKKRQAAKISRLAIASGSVQSPPQ